MTDRESKTYTDITEDGQRSVVMDIGGNDILRKCRTESKYTVCAHLHVPVSFTSHSSCLTSSSHTANSEVTVVIVNDHRLSVRLTVIITHHLNTVKLGCTSGQILINSYRTHNRTLIVKITLCIHHGMSEVRQETPYAAVYTTYV